jgi:RND family efflux transporter MFP subunit
MTLGSKALLPAAVLIGSLAASAALVVARPTPEAQATLDRAPVVAVVTAEPGVARMLVRAQGTVEPCTENELVAEVAGRIAWLSPSLESGSFFAAGEVLARIEASDYEIAAERARAARARAHSQLAFAEASLVRSRALFEAGATSLAAHDQAESVAAIAAANLREAEALLRQAELDLARTELRVPFAGRVREERADFGQLVARGASLATVYAVDYAEVRLPVRSEELAFLDLPLDGAPPSEGPRVQLTGTFAGRTQRWQGRVVRTEGAIDSRTRLVYVVARVEDPYVPAEAGAPPLAVGLFVEAEIEGRELADVVELPRSALRSEREVVVVSADSKLRTRAVDVLRVDDESVWLNGGLDAGERVCTRVPSLFVEGMSVRISEQPSEAAVSGREPAS